MGPHSIWRVIFHTVSRFRRKTPGHGRNLEQGLSSLEPGEFQGCAPLRAPNTGWLRKLVTLIATFGCWIYVRETSRNLSFELLDRETGRAQSPYQR